MVHFGLIRSISTGRFTMGDTTIAEVLGACERSNHRSKTERKSAGGRPILSQLQIENAQDRDERILATLPEGKFTTLEAVKALKCKTRYANFRLRDMADRNLLEAFGGNRNRTWRKI